MQSDIASADRIYCIFRNITVRVTFDTLVGIVSDEGQTAFVIWVGGTDDWMTCVEEDLLRILNGVPQRRSLVGNHMACKPDTTL